jgi:hypothetical protein
MVMLLSMVDARRVALNQCDSNHFIQKAPARDRKMSGRAVTAKKNLVAPKVFPGSVKAARLAQRSAAVRRWC